MTVGRTDARTVALVSIGGAVGTVLRYEVGRSASVTSGTFPTTTLVINVCGAFVLGLLLGALGRHRPADTLWRPLIGVGVLGGFTTFSTFAVETVQLFRSHHPVIGTLYVLASITAGLLAARLGELLVGATPALIPEDEA